MITIEEQNVEEKNERTAGKMRTTVPLNPAFWVDRKRWESVYRMEAKPLSWKAAANEVSEVRLPMLAGIQRKQTDIRLEIQHFLNPAFPDERSKVKTFSVVGNRNGKHNRCSFV